MKRRSGFFTKRAPAAVLAGCCVLWIGGCITVSEDGDETVDEVNAQYVREFTHVEFDEKKNLNFIISPPYFPRGRMGPQVSLIAKWRPGDRPQYQVYLFHPLDRWAYYEGALDREGNPLEVEFLGRVKQSDVLFEERIAAYVPRASLEAAVAEAFAMDFIGRNRREAVRIPGFFVEGFLTKVNGILRERGIRDRLDREASELPPEAGAKPK